MWFYFSLDFNDIDTYNNFFIHYVVQTLKIQTYVCSILPEIPKTNEF